MTDSNSQPIVLTLPGTSSVRISRTTCPETGLDIDLYQPQGAAGGSRPAVLFPAGYPDPGFRRVMGCAFKDLGTTAAWARLLAASGLVGITYENTDPRADARRVLAFIRANGDDLGVDPDRIGLWACSGHVPTALWLMSAPSPPIRCAALLYGYLMDLPGHGEVAAAARQFGFAPGPDVLDDLCSVPMLVVRAGRDDMPGLLASTDRFVAASLGQLPLALLCYPEGRHAFDLSDDSAESLITLRSVVDFLCRRLIG